jgi:hypothetical protein
MKHTIKQYQVLVLWLPQVIRSIMCKQQAMLSLGARKRSLYQEQREQQLRGGNSRLVGDREQGC